MGACHDLFQAHIIHVTVTHLCIFPPLVMSSYCMWISVVSSHYCSFVLDYTWSVFDILVD